MESHLTSGVGIMLHMDLKVKAMKDQLKSDMRVETNHMRYAMDCRSWIEDNRDKGDTADIFIYQIRRPDITENPISGLLCIFVWQGAWVPMTIRYESPTSPPTIKFPDGFFHLNVQPSGLVLTEDIGWSIEASLTEVLCNIRRLLSNPNTKMARNPKAKDCYANEGLDGYRILSREENSRYYPDSKDNSPDMMCPGEKADDLDIIRKWQVANEMPWSSSIRWKYLSEMSS